ncbi:MAG: hypothetical protein Q4F69_03990 [Bacteroidia bacterium]|nr:hypothetical protein [Bacteroidia bacterium]
MKKILILAIITSLSMSSFSQIEDDYNNFVKEYQRGIQDMHKEMDDFKAKANAEFADFIAKEWKLFNDFKAEQLDMNTPKLKEIPLAKTSDKNTNIRDCGVEYIEIQPLPVVTNSISTSEKISSLTDNYVIRKRTGHEDTIIYNKFPYNKLTTTETSTNDMLDINFYGCKLKIHFDSHLHIKASSTKESDVAKYLKDMSANDEYAQSLWNDLTEIVDSHGLNEWGYYCLLRSISDKVFTNDNDKVLFCFYMLRNEGNFKTKVARGKDSGLLSLLIAIDNKLDVYSYNFFRFDDNGSKVKYYMVYGGKGNEAVYSYDFCKQDTDKKQMSLDFNRNLNMGKCDIVRTLNLTKDKKITLPYNSSHIAYLNDVPMTVFPIYFASPISIEAQNELRTNLTKIKAEKSPYEFIDMLLHFVQTAFEYKTDDDQFGYEKYFYPEEVIAYPYSDCEDRAALFSWLVTTYTNAKVIGLQYEGHVATAVCFGDDFKIDGDAFTYGGKRYYVCDPTYINASVGMTMPQFIGKTPKVIKLKKAAN